MLNLNGGLRLVLSVLIGIVFMGAANCAVIEIIEQANGSFEIFSDGSRYGGASTRAAAEKVAQKLGAQGNTVNWTKASVNPMGAGATNPNPTATGPKASINSNGTFRSEPFTRAGTQYVREELAGGQIRYKNVATGKYVSASEALGTNVPATTPKSGSNLPATTTKTGANLPATTTKGGSNLPATTNGGGQKPPVNPPKSGPVPANAPKVNVAGAAMGALGMVAGGMAMYDSVDAKAEKTTWADVGTGAMGGLTFASGAAAVVNAIPVGGQIAYGAAMAVGTVVGASGAAAKMFSETDCEHDPVTGQYACCNVSKLTNIQARLVNIGDEMFADFPYVRTCMQGKNKFESNWIKARFLDDHWSKEGEVKFCSGWVMPANGDYKIQAYGSSEQEGKVCWQWECADANMVRTGDRCVEQNALYDGGTLDEVVVVASAIKAGDACPSDRLPQFATAGIYIANGINAQTGLQKWICAATACKDGTYLVQNDKGVSQGWCVAASYCDKIENSHLNIIDGEKTDLKCILNDDAGNVVLTDDVVVADDANVVTQDVPSVDDGTVDEKKQTPCEMGTAGYRMYYGRCISDAEYQQILKQQQDNAAAQSKSAIQSAAGALNAIRSGFKVSVWKDEEGKFNTSRLVSDSVAGVVLGTAGGLITSNVVKKNQVESGFENIQCTVGGQSVANWGDEFVVGIK
ncbi:MAG: hypothetical protein IJD69_03195 [Alphaproteobacteria bacterium]|nr:hypothetical protein [Alphaproteobacteria bacterium]